MTNSLHNMMLAFCFLWNQLYISLSTPSPTYSQCGFENNTYVCTCQAFAECQNYQFICPDNYDCHVKCIGDSSCYNTHIQWPINGTSTLTCMGLRNMCAGVNFPIPDPYKDFVYDCDLEAECARAIIHCPLYANCHIICSGKVSCHSLQIFWSNHSNVVSELTCNGTNNPCYNVLTFSPTSSPTTDPITHEPTLYPTTYRPTSNPTTNDPTTLNPTTSNPTTNGPTTNEPTFYPTTYQPTSYPTEFNSAQVTDDLIYGEGESQDKDSWNGNDKNNNNWIIYLTVFIFCCIFLSIFLFLKKRKSRIKAHVRKFEINFSATIGTAITDNRHGMHGNVNSKSMAMDAVSSIGKEGNNMIQDIINVDREDQEEGAPATSPETNYSQTPGSNVHSNDANDNAITMDDNVTIMNDNGFIVDGDTDEDNYNHETLQ